MIYFAGQTPEVEKCMQYFLTNKENAQCDIDDTLDKKENTNVNGGN